MARALHEARNLELLGNSSLEDWLSLVVTVRSVTLWIGCLSGALLEARNTGIFERETIFMFVAV